MGKTTTQDDNKHEQPLQAVLIADNFDNAWHPITLESYDGSVDGGRGKERPLVLCPLNNVPLLKHSIDFLQVSFIHVVDMLLSEFMVLALINAFHVHQFVDINTYDHFYLMTDMNHISHLQNPKPSGSRSTRTIPYLHHRFRRPRAIPLLQRPLHSIRRQTSIPSLQLSLPPK